MRALICLSLILAMAIVFGQAPTNKVYGFCYGPFVRPYENPEYGAVISQARIAGQLKLLAPYCQAIRTYGSTHGLEFVPVEAKRFHLVVWQGVWLGSDDAANQEEIASLVELCNQGLVDVAIVGSETLYRGDLTEPELVNYIKQVKKATKGKVPVTTAEVYTHFTGKKLIDACDLIMINIYPFWEGSSITQASAFLTQSYQRIEKLNSKKKIVLSESGWPTGGGDYKQSESMSAMAAKYLSYYLKFVKREKIKYFVFEAFDEPWKGKPECRQEAHFGIFRSDGVLKECFRQFFFRKDRM